MSELAVRLTLTRLAARELEAAVRGAGHQRAAEVERGRPGLGLAGEVASHAVLEASQDIDFAAAGGRDVVTRGRPRVAEDAHLDHRRSRRDRCRPTPSRRALFCTTRCVVSPRGRRARGPPGPGWSARPSPARPPSRPKPGPEVAQAGPPVASVAETSMVTLPVLWCTTTPLMLGTSWTLTAHAAARAVVAIGVGREEDLGGRDRPGGLRCAPPLASRSVWLSSANASRCRV